LTAVLCQVGILDGVSKDFHSFFENMDPNGSRNPSFGDDGNACCGEVGSFEHWKRNAMEDGGVTTYPLSERDTLGSSTYDPEGESVRVRIP